MAATPQQIAAHKAAMETFAGRDAAIAAQVLSMDAYYGPSTLTYGTAEVLEDAENGTTVAAAPKVARGALPLTFTLTDSAGGRFAIDAATGEITVADTSLIIYANATSHDIEVVVSDVRDTAFPKTLTVSILESESAQPIEFLYDPEPSLREGDSNGTLAGTVSAFGGVGSITLSLQDDPDGIFALNAGNGQLTLDDASTFDTLVSGGQTSFSATVRATDSDTPTPNTEDLPITVIGVPTTYDPVGIEFQATNDEFAERNAALTSAVDSDELSLGFAFNKASIGDTQAVFWGWRGAGLLAALTIRFEPSGALRIFAASASETTLLTLLTDPLTDLNAWHHCFFSCRNGSSKKDVVLQIDGVNALATESVNINGDIAMSEIARSTVGAGNSGAGSSFFHFDGGIADLMMAQEYKASAADFYADGKLLNPGADGSAVFTDPLLLLGGPSFVVGSTLSDYSGNSNDFTAQGTLAPYEPAPNADAEPTGDVYEAASLSKAHVTAAINMATQDGDIILLPSGDAGYTSELVISSPYKIHIRGQDWLGSKAAYNGAFDNIFSLAETLRTATLNNSGRSAAASALNAAEAAFQPTTKGLQFRLTSDDITLSRLGFTSLTTHAVDYTAYWCRFSEEDVRLESSHLGGGLIHECVTDGLVIQPTARIQSSNSYAFWEAIPITPGGTDMPYVQRCLLRPRASGDGRAAVDPSWQGGKACIRNNVVTGGSGGVAAFRCHGYYKTSAGSPVNSFRYMELLDNLLVNGSDLGWVAIQWAGASGIIKNFRNTYRSSDTLYITLEATEGFRDPVHNPRCSDLTDANYPYPGQTAGPEEGFGLYISEVFHFNTPVTSISSNGFRFGCADEVTKVNRDIFFSDPPVTLLGTHPFESRIVF